MGIRAGKLCCRGTRSTKRSLNNQGTATGKDLSPCSGHKAKISSRYRVEVSCPLDQPCAALDIREKGEGKAQKPPPRPRSPRSSRSGSSWTSRPAGLNFSPWANSNPHLFLELCAGALEIRSKTRRILLSAAPRPGLETSALPEASIVSEFKAERHRAPLWLRDGHPPRKALPTEGPPAASPPPPKNSPVQLARAAS